MKFITVLNFNVRLLSGMKKISQQYKCMAVASTLAYYDMSTITTISFYIIGPLVWPSPCPFLSFQSSPLQSGKWHFLASILLSWPTQEKPLAMPEIKCCSLCWTPDPQVTEHWLQGPKFDHPHGMATFSSEINWNNFQPSCKNSKIIILKCTVYIEPRGEH